MGRVELAPDPTTTQSTPVDRLHRAIQNLQNPQLPATQAEIEAVLDDFDEKQEPDSTVDEAIHRILTTQQTDTAHTPSFEEVLVDMNPVDLTVVQKIKDAVENRG